MRVPEILVKRNDRVRSIDPRGRVAVDVTNCNISQRTEVSELFERLPIETDKYYVKILVAAEALQLPGLAVTIVKLCKAVTTFASVDLEFHFGDRLFDISDLLAIVRKLRIDDVIRGPVTVFAQLCVNDEASLKAMFELGISPRYTVGLPGAHFSKGDLDLIRFYSNFGCLIPANFLISADNISLIEAEIKPYMAASHCAGFGMPLVSTSPYYRFDENGPQLPDQFEYCQLLTRQYSAYSAFDHFLSPITEIVDLLGHLGAWNRESGFHKITKLMIDCSGDICAFRQAPSLGLRWSTIETIVGQDVPELSRSLITFLRNRFGWDKNSFCSPCRWKSICGGIDSFGKPVDKPDLLAMCLHRALFLEHFAGSLETISADKLKGIFPK